MIIHKGLKILLIAVGLLTLNTPIALSESSDSQRLICDGNGHVVQAETKNYIINICTQSQEAFDRPVIYEAYRKNPLRFGISVPLLRETDKQRGIYVALNGDYRYTLNFRKRQLLVTRRGKRVIRERIIHWCSYPGIANSCQF